MSLSTKTVRLFLMMMLFALPSCTVFKNKKSRTVNQSGEKTSTITQRQDVEIINVVKPAPEKPKKTKKQVLTPQECYTLLDELYQGVSGFGVGSEQEKIVISAGGAPTYGEIKYEGLQTIIDDLKPTKNDVFYDLGCGVGKVAMQMYLMTPVKKSVGVELCPKRYEDAMKVREKLANKGYIEKDRNLEFTEEDITKANFKDATIIFTCSTCFGPELMLKLVKKFAECKPGLKVLSLKDLPEHQKHGFKEIKRVENGIESAKYKVPMSWMPEGSTVYLYELVG